MPYQFLVASWGSAGHLGPMLAGARQLRARGHGVRFIGREGVRTAVEAAGFDCVVWQRTPSYTPLAGDTNDLGRFFDELMFGPAAAQGADSRDEIERTPTDAVLTDLGLVGAALAAEAMHIPCAILSPTLSLRPLPGVPPVSSGLRRPRTPQEHAEVEAAASQSVAVMNGWLPMLNDARASLGLGSCDDVLEVFDRRARLLLAVCAAFDFPATSLPGNVRYIGPLLDPAEWWQPWVSPWSLESDVPRALIAFSTTNQNQGGALQRTINAVGRIEMEAVATLGPIEASTLQAPKTVTLVSGAAHDAVMKDVSLAVTHGGHGTTSRALRYGLPLLVMPMGRDQDDIALRVEACGAGLVLPPTASETQIAAALDRLIKDPQFRNSAQRISEAMAAEIDKAGLVTEMEAIVREQAV